MNPVPKNKAEKNREFLDWIARQPHCATCGASGVYHESTGEFLLDPSHIISRGAGGGDIGNALPSCRDCHTKLHRIGVTLFSLLVKKDLKVLAMAYAKRWKYGQKENQHD